MYFNFVKPDDEANSDMTKYLREKDEYASITLGQEYVFSSQHEGAKRPDKGSIWLECVFSSRAAMPNVFTTGWSPVRNLPAPFLPAAAVKMSHLSFNAGF